MIINTNFACSSNNEQDYQNASLTSKEEVESLENPPFLEKTPNKQLHRFIKTKLAGKTSRIGLKECSQWCEEAASLSDSPSTSAEEAQGFQKSKFVKKPAKAARSQVAIKINKRQDGKQEKDNKAPTAHLSTLRKARSLEDLSSTSPDKAQDLHDFVSQYEKRVEGEITKMVEGIESQKEIKEFSQEKKQSHSRSLPSTGFALMDDILQNLTDHVLLCTKTLLHRPERAYSAAYYYPWFFTLIPFFLRYRLNPSRLARPLAILAERYSDDKILKKFEYEMLRVHCAYNQCYPNVTMEKEVKQIAKQLINITIAGGKPKWCLDSFCAQEARLYVLAKEVLASNNVIAIPQIRRCIINCTKAKANIDQKME